MQEMRAAVPHHDRLRHADLFKRRRLERHRLALRLGRVIGHVDQRGGGELDGREAGIEGARGKHLVEQCLGHRLACLIVHRVALEDIRHRQPVFVELRRQLHEVPGDAGAGNRGVGDVG
ncbi:hypothetical protein D3C78_1675170 [compost metagenome]